MRKDFGTHKHRIQLNICSGSRQSTVGKGTRPYSERENPGTMSTFDPKRSIVDSDSFPRFDSGKRKASEIRLRVGLAMLHVVSRNPQLKGSGIFCRKTLEGGILRRSSDQHSLYTVGKTLVDRSPGAAYPMWHTERCEKPALDAIQTPTGLFIGSVAELPLEQTVDGR